MAQPEDGLLAHLSTVVGFCDVNQLGNTTVADVQQMISEALGKASPANDLNKDGVVNTIDIQIVTNAVLGFGCTAK